MNARVGKTWEVYLPRSFSQRFSGLSEFVQVVSDTHVDGFYYRPRTDLETLAEHAQGLIGFTGCMQGWVLASLA